MSVANLGFGHGTCSPFLYPVDYTGVTLEFVRGQDLRYGPKWKGAFFVDTFCHPLTPECVSPSYDL